ncbi:MAG: DUF975 family protein [Clostridia bacterium]|nr:DUF975 family protein [Clostridia bacterium]
MEIKDLKKRALAQLKTRWTDVVLACFLYGLILGAASSTVIGTFILVGPLTYGFHLYMSNFVRTSERKIETIFEGFKDFVDNLITGVLQTVYIALWSLLFVVPGIIAAYSYACTFYIKAAMPELSPSECLAKSKEVMDGYKMKLFLLDLSFIGWVLLCALTFGIGVLFLEPYMETTRANFIVMLLREKGIMKKPETKEEEVESETIIVDVEEGEGEI